MRIYFLLAALLFFVSVAAQKKNVLAIYDLRCENFRLEPLPGGKFSFVKASFDSPHGEIRSDWEIKDGVINYTVKIPANTTADIRLPKAGGKIVSMNGKPLTGLRQEGEHASLSRGSGDYIFSWAW